jgi:hypothetical protein
MRDGFRVPDDRLKLHFAKVPGAGDNAVQER